MLINKFTIKLKKNELNEKKETANLKLVKNRGELVVWVEWVELKIEMIAEATKDAQIRASQIADNAGGSLGKLKRADMGVFQIVAQNSSEEYSWGGSFNTSSKRKTASITVRLEYAADWSVGVIFNLE